VDNWSLIGVKFTTQIQEAGYLSVIIYIKYLSDFGFSITFSISALILLFRSVTGGIFPSGSLAEML
jgi:hypothetical protein